MSILIATDLHQTDRPQDEYRWGIFPWLEKKADQLDASHILILGDLTDSKDKHSAALVNRLVDNIHPPGWIFLKGNHDFVSADCPFFGFLDRLGMPFISKPKSMRLDIGRCLFLPSTRDWREDWAGLDFSEYDYIFTHATFEGAVAENGQELPGIPISIFRDFKGKGIYGGDIHVPQRHGPVTYVGAPYAIRFGDSFEPRVIFIGDDGKVQEFQYPAPKKRVIRLDTNLLGSLLVVDAPWKGADSIREGDQVKIEVSLRRAEYADWPKLKRSIVSIAEKNGWNIHSLYPVMIEQRSTSVAIERQSDDGIPIRQTAKELVELHAARYKADNGTLKVGLELVR